MRYIDKLYLTPCSAQESHNEFSIILHRLLHDQSTYEFQSTLIAEILGKRLIISFQQTSTILFHIVQCSKPNNDNILPLGLIFQIAHSLNLRNSLNSVKDTIFGYRKVIMFDIK